MISGNVEIGNLLKRLRKVPMEAPRIIKKAIDTDARGFVRDIVAITPPSQGKLNLESKQRGEKKTKADIRQAYGTPADMWQLIHDKQGKGAAGQFWSLIKNRQIKQANDMARRLIGKEMMPFDNGAEHQRKRSRKTGRVIGGKLPKHKDVFLSQQAMPKFRKYSKEKIKLVGLLASGFVPAARELGVKLPAWITRHQSQPGTVIPKTTRTGYTITIANTARYASNAELPRRIREVLAYDKRKKRIANVIKYDIAAVLKKQRLT